MGVVLRNLQNVVPLRRAKLRKDVEILRRIFGVQRFDMGIICVDNRKIQHINHIYRKKNQPTDVLSFPFYEVQPLARLIFLALYFFLLLIDSTGGTWPVIMLLYINIGHRQVARACPVLVAVEVRPMSESEQLKEIMAEFCFISLGSEARQNPMRPPKR